MFAVLSARATLNVVMLSRIESREKGTNAMMMFKLAATSLNIEQFVSLLVIISRQTRGG